MRTGQKGPSSLVLGEPQIWNPCELSVSYISATYHWSWLPGSHVGSVPTAHKGDSCVCIIKKSSSEPEVTHKGIIPLRDTEGEYTHTHKCTRAQAPAILQSKILLLTVAFYSLQVI